MSDSGRVNECCGDTVGHRVDCPSQGRRSKKMCDYAGYSCECDGYRKAQEGSTLCVCGHAKSQHHERSS